MRSLLSFAFVCHVYLFEWLTVGSEDIRFLMSLGTSSYTRIEELRLISRHYGNFAALAQTALYQRAWEQSLPSPALKTIGLKSPASSQQPPAVHGVDEALFRQLTGMGFGSQRVMRACHATQNAGNILNIPVFRQILPAAESQCPVLDCNWDQKRLAMAAALSFHLPFFGTSSLLLQRRSSCLELSEI